jgi:3-hydroxybutyrate dehydrogenase|tara:strand:+ start:2937 stop:3644 length:708 start_codon:yes stop_codon:yes gene_type:complete
LKGKTILITGAASGLGKAWAELFNQEGANIFACDIKESGLYDLQELGIKTSTLDVSSSQQVKSFIEQAHDATGRLDVLFNNAGMGFGYKVHDMPEGVFEHHVSVHLFGTIYGMRYALPIMKKQNYGRIINTISRNAETDVEGTSAYAAAKAGIWSATRVAAKENAEHDILINMIIPGPTNTSIWGKDMPHLQKPEATFPTAKLLASLERGGPTGKVYWDEKEYQMFNQNNSILKK